MPLVLNGDNKTVLQVVQTVKTDTFSVYGSTTFTDITGMSVTITPTSLSSKLLVMVDCATGAGASLGVLVRLLRGSTPIYTGDTASTRPLSLAQQFTTQYNTQRTGGIYLDSPATISPVTYKLQMATTSTGDYGYINRTYADRDSGGYDTRTASSITVMEISG